MLILISRGHVIPTIAFINKCVKEQDTDMSLIRHFVTEVKYFFFNVTFTKKISL